jgi:hypothetical protein
MKNANANVVSNKPDGLSIALIIILVLIIVACILWYMFYKPRPIVRQSVEGFSDEINNLKFFQKNNIGKVVSTNPVYSQVDVLEGSLMTSDQINAHFGSAKKKRH